MPCTYKTQKRGDGRVAALNKCPVCGLEYTLKKYDVKGVVKSIYIPECSCIEKRFQKRIKARKTNIRDEEKYILPINFLPPVFYRYNFENIPKTRTVKACREFANNFQKGKNGGFSFIGTSGCGKSVLLASICQEIRKAGFSYLFINTAELTDKIISGYDYSTGVKPEKIFVLLRNIDFVVLDDFGRGCLSDRCRYFLHRIVDELDKYECCVSFSAAPEILAALKSCANTEGMLDRLFRLCPHRYIFKGKSFRRYAKKNCTYAISGIEVF